MTNKREWQSDYEQRLLEPEAAMDLIEAGDWVNVNVGTPAAITVLLNARAEALGVIPGVGTISDFLTRDYLSAGALEVAPE